MIPLPRRADGDLRVPAAEAAGWAVAAVATGSDWPTGSAMAIRTGTDSGWRTDSVMEMPMVTGSG